jgi:hypothetical protein
MVSLIFISDFSILRISESQMASQNNLWNVVQQTWLNKNEQKHDKIAVLVRVHFKDGAYGLPYAHGTPPVSLFERLKKRIRNATSMEPAIRMTFATVSYSGSFTDDIHQQLLTQVKIQP